MNIRKAEARANGYFGRKNTKFAGKQRAFSFSDYIHNPGRNQCVNCASDYMKYAENGQCQGCLQQNEHFNKKSVRYSLIRHEDDDV